MADEKKDSKNKKTKRPTALKRDLQNEKRRLRNRSFKSKIKTMIRSFKEKEEGIDLNQLYSTLDKGVKMGIYKQNKASRLKSRLSQSS